MCTVRRYYLSHKDTGNSYLPNSQQILLVSSECCAQISGQRRFFNAPQMVAQLSWIVVTQLQQKGSDCLSVLCLVKLRKPSSSTKVWWSSNIFFMVTQVVMCGLFVVAHLLGLCFQMTELVVCL